MRELLKRSMMILKPFAAELIILGLVLAIGLLANISHAASGATGL